ncbi:MAG: dockerin type I domain-containing protein [Candidatus Saccharibacteria bacterium]
MAKLSFNKHSKYFLSIASVLIFALIGSYIIFSSKAETALSADFNSDNTVNIYDLSIMASNWAKTSVTHAMGDANADLAINIFDLSLLASQWGQTITPTPPTYTIIPTGDDTGTLDATNIQAAIDSKGTNGGEITFAPGTYTISSPIKLPAGNLAILILSGNGAIINLVNTTPRFFVWDRTAMHQTFRKFFIEGFNVDAGNNHPASGSWSVLGFDMKSGSGYYDAGYLNIEEITIKDNHIYNVATSSISTWNAIDIHVGVSHWGDESTENHINDILVQGCRLEGGERGVNINGYGNIASATNITLDRIFIRDCWHDTGVDPVQFGQSTNYHVGQSGKLGTVEITNSYGARSFDCGVEVDQAANGLVQDVTIENPYYNMFYYTNFNTPLSGAGKTIFNRNTARSTIATYGANGFGVGYEGLGIGDIILTDFKYASSLTGWRTAVNIPDNSIIKSLSINGLNISAPNTSTTPQAYIYTGGVIQSKSISTITVNGSFVNY